MPLPETTGKEGVDNMDHSRERVTPREVGSAPVNRNNDARRAMESDSHRRWREEREKQAKEEDEKKEKLAILRKQQQAEAGRQAMAEAAKKEAARRAMAEATKVSRETLARAHSLVKDLTAEPRTLISPIRTLKSDMASLIQNHDLSASRIALTNKLPGTKDNTGSGYWVKTFLLVIIFLLLAGGIGLVYFAWQAKQNEATLSPSKTAINSLVVAEAHLEIATDKKDQESLLSEIAAAKLVAAGQAGVTNIYFTVIDDLAERQVKRFLPFTVLKEKLGLSIPDTLLVTLRPEFMYGFYQGAPFFVFKIRFFENAAAEMLKLEPVLARHLTPFLVIPENARGDFIGRVIKNHDTRVLSQELDGKGVLLIYSFINRETLVLATTQAVFEEVTSRFFVTSDKHNP